MWDLPGPGLEPLSPALAGGFLTIVPPRKPYLFSIWRIIWPICIHWYRQRRLNLSLVLRKMSTKTWNRFNLSKKPQENKGYGVRIMGNVWRYRVDYIYFRNQATNMDFIHRAGVSKIVVCMPLLKSKMNLVVQSSFFNFILVFMHFL